MKETTKKRKNAIWGIGKACGRHWIVEQLYVEQLYQVYAKGKQGFDACMKEMGRLMVETIMYIEREEMAGPDYHPFNRAYGECAKHYGFIIDPAKIARGDHKGKVERKLPVVRQQFLSSGDFRDIRDANEKVRHWCLHEYGMELHGTTKGGLLRSSPQRRSRS
jgi:hypothetical protein